MLHSPRVGECLMRIICKDLSFSYEPKKKNTAYALENVNLTIEEGEFFGIIGHTGSGKSTFARKLQQKTKLPLYYLDMLWHKSDKTNVTIV